MDFEQYAQLLRQQYENFTNRLGMEFVTYRSSGSAGPSAMRTTGVMTVDSFVTAASSATRAYLRGLGVDTPLHTTVGYLNQLHAIAMTNLNELVLRLSSPAALAIKSVLTHQTGAMAQLARQADAAGQLTAKDGAGRTWQANKLVALLSRDFAYQAYVDASLAQIAAAGYDMAQLTYPDQSHRNQGLALRLDEVPAMRDVLFHPNATARLEAYVQA